MQVKTHFGKSLIDPKIAKCGCFLTGSEDWPRYINWLNKLPVEFNGVVDRNILLNPSELNWGLSAVYTGVGYKLTFWGGLYAHFSPADFSNILILENYTTNPELRFQNLQEAITTALITSYYPMRNCNPQANLFYVDGHGESLTYTGGKRTICPSDPNLNIVILNGVCLPTSKVWEQIIYLTDSNSRTVLIADTFPVKPIDQVQ